METEHIGSCWNCRHGLTKADYGREATCPGCGKSTRCCRNCRHYAPGRPNDCLEPMEERILDKSKANFCELFEPAENPLPSGAKPDLDALRQAADDLFKG
jgi:hypothetical protein